MPCDGFSRAGRFPRRGRAASPARGEETNAMKTTGLLFAALTLAATGVLADESWKARREAALAQAYADHNGALSPAEFATFVAALKQIRLQNRFARLDTNGDGQLTLAEIEAAPRHRHLCGGGN